MFGRKSKNQIVSDCQKKIAIARAITDMLDETRKSQQRRASLEVDSSFSTQYVDRFDDFHDND